MLNHPPPGAFHASDVLERPPQDGDAATVDVAGHHGEVAEEEHRVGHQVTTFVRGAHDSEDEHEDEEPEAAS